MTFSTLAKIYAREELLRVRETLEKGWTRGAYARDRDGYAVPPKSPQAVCWCILGAFVHHGFTCGGGGDGWAALEAVCDPTPVVANDEKFQDKQDALAAIDRALALVSE